MPWSTVLAPCTVCPATKVEIDQKAAGMRLAASRGSELVVNIGVFALDGPALDDQNDTGETVAVQDPRVPVLRGVAMRLVHRPCSVSMSVSVSNSE